MFVTGMDSEDECLGFPGGVIDDDGFLHIPDCVNLDESSEDVALNDAIFELYKKHKSKMSRKDADDKPESRCDCPKYLSDVVNSLSADQLQSIEAIGFGAFLHFDDFHVPKAFISWICSKFDVRTSELVLKDRVIPFSKVTVHKVLGVPIGGQKVVFDSESGKNFLLRMFDLMELQCTKYFGHKLLAKEDLSDDQFVVCFMVVAFSSLFCVNHTVQPSTQVLAAFQDLHEVDSFDWAFYLYTKVIEFVSLFPKLCCKLKDDSFCFGACSYVLAVFYLDCVNFGSYEVSLDIPRISCWKRSMIKYCSELDEIQCFKFGRRPLKHLIDPSYEMVSSNNFDKDEPMFAKLSSSADFKSNLESLYGSVLPEELKMGICKIYENHCVQQAKNYEMSCQELILRIFSFCNELSVSMGNDKNVMSTDNCHGDHILCEEKDLFREQGVCDSFQNHECFQDALNVGNHAAQVACCDDLVDLSLKIGVRNSVGFVDLDDGIEVNLQKLCRPVIDLSTPGFLNFANKNCSQSSSVKVPSPIVKAKKDAMHSFVDKVNAFDLNCSASCSEVADIYLQTPKDGFVDVNLMPPVTASVAMKSAPLLFGKPYSSSRSKPIPKLSQPVFDVETQQYVRNRDNSIKARGKVVRKSEGFLWDVGSAACPVPACESELNNENACFCEVTELVAHTALPARKDDFCMLMGMKIAKSNPVCELNDVECEAVLPLNKLHCKDGVVDKHLNCKFSKVKEKEIVPVIDVDEIDNKVNANGNDNDDVEFVREVNFLDKIKELCNKSEILDIKTSAAGSKCALASFQKPSVCRPLEWSSKFVVTDKQRRNYLAACRLASSTRWNDCYVKFRELGNSLRTGCKVGNFVINALCRKFFLDKRPTISRKHYFFSGVGAVLLKGSGNLSYVKKCFDGAGSVLALHKADMLLFPICHDDHWFVFVVDIKNSLFVFLDSYYGEADDYHVFVRSNLVPNFKRIWKELVKSPLDFENYDIVYPPVPKQTNLIDCGVFVIMFLTFWTWYCGLCINFSQDDIDNIRIHTVSNLVCSEHNIANSSPITNYFGEGSFPRVGEIRKSTVQY
ncbi:hypothetical protein ACP70R_041286 [Stipagrostis hirtigluma subsp. patula]